MTVETCALVVVPFFAYFVYVCEDSEGFIELDIVMNYLPLLFLYTVAYDYLGYLFDPGERKTTR